MDLQCLLVVGPLHMGANRFEEIEGRAKSLDKELPIGSLSYTVCPQHIGRSHLRISQMSDEAVAMRISPGSELEMCKHLFDSHRRSIAIYQSDCCGRVANIPVFRNCSQRLLDQSRHPCDTTKQPVTEHAFHLAPGPDEPLSTITPPPEVNSYE